jgi:hypothetical protein
MLRLWMWMQNVPLPPTDIQNYIYKKDTDSENFEDVYVFLFQKKTWEKYLLFLVTRLRK